MNDLIPLAYKLLLQKNVSHSEIKAIEYIYKKKVHEMNYLPNVPFAKKIFSNILRSVQENFKHSYYYIAIIESSDADIQERIDSLDMKISLAFSQEDKLLIRRKYGKEDARKVYINDEIIHLTIPGVYLTFKPRNSEEIALTSIHPNKEYLTPECLANSFCYSLHNPTFSALEIFLQRQSLEMNKITSLASKCVSEIAQCEKTFAKKYMKKGDDYFLQVDI